MTSGMPLVCSELRSSRDTSNPSLPALHHHVQDDEVGPMRRRPPPGTAGRCTPRARGNRSAPAGCGSSPRSPRRRQPAARFVPSSWVSSLGLGSRLEGGRGRSCPSPTSLSTRDVPRVHFHHAVDDGQTHAGALAQLLRGVEGREDLLDDLRRHAAPGVPHAQVHGVPLRGESRAHHHFPRGTSASRCSRGRPAPGGLPPRRSRSARGSRASGGSARRPAGAGAAPPQPRRARAPPRPIRFEP